MLELVANCQMQLPLSSFRIPGVHMSLTQKVSIVATTSLQPYGYYGNNCVRAISISAIAAASAPWKATLCPRKNGKSNGKKRSLYWALRLMQLFVWQNGKLNFCA